jgi:hypothetical protein
VDDRGQSVEGKGEGRGQYFSSSSRGRLLKWKRTIRLVKDCGHYRS